MCDIFRICTEHRVLGFDCEWVTKNGTRHPIALLQLASHDGFCALIRLSKIQHVPSELRVIRMINYVVVNAKHEC